MPKQIPVRMAGAQIPCTPSVKDNVEHIKKDSVAQLVEHLLKSEMDIIHEIKENNRR